MLTYVKDYNDLLKFDKTLCEIENVIAKYERQSYLLHLTMSIEDERVCYSYDGDYDREYNDFTVDFLFAKTDEEWEAAEQKEKEHRRILREKELEEERLKKEKEAKELEEEELKELARLKAKYERK